MAHHLRHALLLNHFRSPSLSSSRRFLTPLPLLPRRPLSSRQNPHGTRRAFATAAEVAETAEVSGTEGGDDRCFFADEGVTWQSLGISNQLSHALSSISLNKPSSIQASCIPQILTGKDVIIAAETGSGKTHGYLVPLIDKLCTILDPCEGTDVTHGTPERQRVSLVLCPNVMLCDQVVQMANCLLNDLGEPLLRVASVCGGQGWPVVQPHVLVSTPAALLNSLFALDPERRRRVDFLRNVKYVVFDEADMLLCGSFQNQIIRLINLFRFDEKQLSRTQESLQDSSTDFNDEKQLSRTQESLQDSSTDFNDGSHADSEFEDDHVQQFLSNEEEEVDRDCLESMKIKNTVEASGVKGWRRVRKVYTRSKQYIFVAATLPVNGKQTAGGVLKRMFPDAIWVSGNYLHRHNPRLELRWVEVTADTQVDALLDAVKCSSMVNNSTSGDCLSRTMVFTNTVEATESVAKILRTAGIGCIAYHSESSLEDRTNSLNAFRQKGGFLVCTDAAARGLDVHNVSHVIQAEFATSAVDFLHRIGRTARAGQSGTVTSLYTKSNRDLVSAVRQAGTMGQPVEKAFSRKRGFRNKLKKRGRIEAQEAHNVPA